MKFSKALCVFMLAATASQTVFAGRLTASYCVADKRGAFYQDHCQAIEPQSGDKRCEISLQEGIVSVEASELHVLTGQKLISSQTMGGAYQADLGNNAATTRHTLNFGGMNRGMAIVASRGGRAIGLARVEVYLNHDHQGRAYTRLTCR